MTHKSFDGIFVYRKEPAWKRWLVTTVEAVLFVAILAVFGLTVFVWTAAFTPSV